MSNVARIKISCVTGRQGRGQGRREWGREGMALFLFNLRKTSVMTHLEHTVHTTHYTLTYL